MANQRSIGELDEIVLNIFLSLETNDVLKCSLVCKRWNRVANDNSLWKMLVLNRWKSQRAVLSQVSTVALQWQKLYRYLLGIGNYSPDDMKYFIVCKLGETIPDSPELQRAIFNAMEEINSRWEKPRLFELEETSPRLFNSNMELYYDTHDLRWVFVDRRREYVDDSFTIRLNQDRMSGRQMRFIRPYQVMASCIMMYRWLILFKYMFTEDVGLAFYRIWRFRLKHLETGFIFETYDWKAAMSSTFSHGCPVSTKFRDDGLAVLDMLSSPFFVSHPMGSAYKLCYEVPCPVSSESVFSSASVSRSSSMETLDCAKSETKLAGEFSATSTPSSECLVSPLPAQKAVEASMCPPPKGVIQSVDNISVQSEDQESEDNGDDYGYFCNCEHFIHRSSWEYEEQQMIQADAATRWETLMNHPRPTFEMVFDSFEEKWLFCLYDAKNLECPQRLNRQAIEKSLEFAKHIRDAADDEQEITDVANMVSFKNAMPASGNVGSASTTKRVLGNGSGTIAEAEQPNMNLGLEAMPSSLTLYRLICLFDLASPQYKSAEPGCVWSVCLQHRMTRGIVQLKDLNGWLRVFVTLNRQLRLYCSDLAVMSLNRNIGFLDDSKTSGYPCKSKGDGLSSTSSDNHSEVSSEDGSSDDEFGNPLERFKEDACSMLQLLVCQKFAHPYGTVAGAVA